MSAKHNMSKSKSRLFVSQTITEVRIIETYRANIPRLSEIEEDTVKDKQDINNDEQMMRIPKGVKTGKSIKWLRKLDEVTPKPSCC